MRSEIRWTIVVVVFAVAGVVALWPHAVSPQPPTPARAGPPQIGVGTAANSMPPDDGELAPLRQRADLQPCPAPPPGAAVPSGPLAGVVVPCLGAPGTVDLAAGLAARPALLNLWASWCGPCREEIPVLAAYAQQPDSIPVIGINVQDRPEAALALLAELGARYPSVIDTDGKLRVGLRAPPVLPISYLLHPDGSVERVTSPAVFRNPGEVRLAVARHLGVRG